VCSPGSMCASGCSMISCNSCGQWNGTCGGTCTCGAPMQPCCGGTTCNSGLNCVGGTCLPPCGDAGQVCCMMPPPCGTNLGCNPGTGTCQPCGYTGEPCCFGGTCLGSGLWCNAGYCQVPGGDSGPPPIDAGGSG
jgi:hypothetical protein